MTDGLHLYVSNQVIGQTRIAKDSVNPSNIAGYPGEFQGDLMTYLFPNAYAVYKMDKMAFSAGFVPVGGGGSADFADGLPSIYGAMASTLSTPGLTGIKDPKVTSYGSSAYIGG